MDAKQYYNSTRLVETNWEWTLKMALAFAEEYSEAVNDCKCSKEQEPVINQTAEQITIEQLREENESLKDVIRDYRKSTEYWQQKYFAQYKK